MLLPLDASTAPYREKYLDAIPAFADWFIFGESNQGVDISDGLDDVIIKIDKASAERLIAARDVFCKAIRKELAL